PPTTDTSPLSLHDALPICIRTHHIVRPRVDDAIAFFYRRDNRSACTFAHFQFTDRLAETWRIITYFYPFDTEVVECNLDGFKRRSEEHTSELQSRENLVCR